MPPPIALPPPSQTSKRRLDSSTESSGSEMKKRSLSFLTLLAIGAFFARSPEARHWGRSLFQESADNPPTLGGGPLVEVNRSTEGGLLLATEAPHDEVQIPALQSAEPKIDSEPSKAQLEPADQEDSLKNAVAAVPESKIRELLESSL